MTSHSAGGGPETAERVVYTIGAVAEIMGLGLTHYPALSLPDESMAGLLRGFTMRDPSIPADALDPRSWPDRMRDEWADDQGRSSAVTHREHLTAALRRCRTALDEFEPDVIVMWGDDQYENFREDLIPPYAILALPDMEVYPWAHASESSWTADQPNAWGEPLDFHFTVRGRPDIGRHLATGLLSRGVDVSYAYEPRHHPGLSHAFLNAILYLDYDRRGFPFPVLPFPINSYGTRAVSYRGNVNHLADVREPDPPSPRPDRLFLLGEQAAAVLAESPWRVALVASSSWSHAFLTDKTHRLRPDTDSDRVMYQSLVEGDYARWRDRPLADYTDAGQHELLNWVPLAGAMQALGQKVTWSVMVETDVFNSNKVFATFV